MEEAAVSQSIRNWKLLSDLKETASSVHIKGEEAGGDFSVFSRQNLYGRHQELPAYERLINRISFNKPRRPLHLQTRFSSLIKLGYLQDRTAVLNSRNQTKWFRLLALLFFCGLIFALIVLI